MSLLIVIYSIWSISAFWELHEKAISIHKFAGFFPRELEVDLGAISGGYWEHFGSTLVPQIANKMQSTSYNKKLLNKRPATIPTQGGACPQTIPKTSRSTPSAGAVRHLLNTPLRAQCTVANTWDGYIWPNSVSLHVDGALCLFHWALQGLALQKSRYGQGLPTSHMHNCENHMQRIWPGI